MGSNPGKGEIFRTCPDRPWEPHSLLYNGYRVFPRDKERPGRDADPSLPSSDVVMKGYSYTSNLPRSCTACTEPQCLYKGALYLYKTKQLSRYSDWLRAGRSMDRIPVKAIFSAPVQTGPGTLPASCTMGTVSFQGIKSGRGLMLTTHSLLVPWS